jgi:hypothetical protein
MIGGRRFVWQAWRIYDAKLFPLLAPLELGRKLRLILLLEK